MNDSYRTAICRRLRQILQVLIRLLLYICQTIFHNRKHLRAGFLTLSAADAAFPVNPYMRMPFSFQLLHPIICKILCLLCSPALLMVGCPLRNTIRVGMD